VYSGVTVVNEENIVLHNYVECVKVRYVPLLRLSLIFTSMHRGEDAADEKYVFYLFIWHYGSSVPSVVVRLYRLNLK
jgi:hypothetical protein